MKLTADNTLSELSPVQNALIRILKEGALIGWLLLCLYLLLALFSYSPNDPSWSSTGNHQAIQNTVGPTGALVADVFFTLFGYLAYLFPLMIAYRVARVFLQRNQLLPFDGLMFCVRIIGLILVIIAGTGLVSLQFGEQVSNLPASNGGIVGLSVASAIESAFGFVGANLLLIALG